MTSSIDYIQINKIVMIALILSMNLETIRGSSARKSSHKVRSFAEVIPKTEEEVFEKTKQATTISPESKTEIIKELEKLIKTVEANTSTEMDDESCNKETCAELKTEVLKNMMLKPAYPCDEWSQELRTCFLNRNLGNTVTFVLATPPPKTAGRVKVEWLQEFKHLDPKKNWISYHINPRDLPWNMIIGSGGHELRISPVTETDLNVNRFTAIVHFQYGTPTRLLHFVIRPILFDAGKLYPGATMTLHVPSFLSLPTEGLTFKWELERDRGKKPRSLPSNMWPSLSGASLRISELRKDQEGLVFCSIYTNLGVQATRVGFDIFKVESDNNKLVFVATRPPHRRKNIKKRSLHFDDILDYYKDSADDKPAVTNTHANLKRKKRRSPLKPRRQNKRQNDESEQTEEPDYDPMKQLGDEYDENSPPDGSQNQLKSDAPKQKSYSGDFDWIENKRFEEEAMIAETPKPIKRPSFLERHRQAILERLRERDHKQKQTKSAAIKRLHATTEAFERLVAVEEDPTLPPLHERDKMSMLLSKCDKDSECSLNAECTKRKKSKPGFCRCLPTFEGNGIFCWEGGKWMM